ncbi:hypothetical protein JCM10450v2_000761 [Rhodotorula kratochvilovae]
MSASSPLPPRAHASLDTLPAELLASIFSLSPRAPLPPFPAPDYPSPSPADPAAPLRLAPSAVPISRALLPFARANAYQRLTVRGGAALAHLGEVLVAREGLGALVRAVEVVDPARQVGLDAEMDPVRVAAALRALPALETLSLALPASPALLAALLRAAARALAPGQGVSLVVHSTRAAPVYVPMLGGVLRARGVRELVVRGRMGVKLRPEDEGMMEALRGAAAEVDERKAEEASGVERVEMEVEPHATGLSTFLDALPRLTHLSVRCFTTDAVAVFSALGPRTRARLTSVEYSSSGYLHRDLAHFPTLLPSLTHLTLSSPSFLLSPAFLAALSSCPLLASLTLRGPHLAGEVSAGAASVQLLAEWVEHLASLPAGERSVLQRLEVAVPPPPGAAVSGEGGARWATRGGSRVEEQARRLKAACGRAGVELGGSVCALAAGRKAA